MHTDALSRRRQACRDAAGAALEAWRAIEPFYRGECEVSEKPGEGPVTEADRLADHMILDYMKARWDEAETGYLTEESADDPSRLDKQRVWIVDPIDGTKDFIRRNGNFAIQIALAEPLEDGRWSPVAAVVYEPIHALLFASVRGEGAFVQSIDGEGRPGEPRRLGVSDRATVAASRSVVSNSNRTSRLTKLIESFGLESFWHIGSMGVKVCAIAGGEAELYVVLARGKVKEWDLCAPHLILDEAGGMATDLEGRPFEYNRPDPKLWHGLMVTHGPLHDEFLVHTRAFLEKHPEPFE